MNNNKIIIINAVETPGGCNHKEDIKEGWSEWRNSPIPGSAGTATKTFISLKAVILGQCECSEGPDRAAALWCELIKWILKHTRKSKEPRSGRSGILKGTQWVGRGQMTRCLKGRALVYGPTHSMWTQSPLSWWQELQERWLWWSLFIVHSMGFGITCETHLWVCQQGSF